KINLRERTIYTKDLTVSEFDKQYTEIINKKYVLLYLFINLTTMRVEEGVFV
ncbi:hypothetical protein HMPREF0506_1073, partial [Lactobacillus crispatus JV-V01]